MTFTHRIRRPTSTGSTVMWGSLCATISQTNNQQHQKQQQFHHWHHHTYHTSNINIHNSNQSHFNLLLQKKEKEKITNNSKRPHIRLFAVNMLSNWFRWHPTNWSNIAECLVICIKLNQSWTFQFFDSFKINYNFLEIHSNQKNHRHTFPSFLSSRIRDIPKS
jgi:hypothetical protein